MSPSVSELTEDYNQAQDPALRGDQPLLKRLWLSRELIFTLVKRDLKVRYKSSAFGFLWSFGRPLLLMAVIAAVFSGLVRIPPGHPYLPYPLHILMGLIPWFFFSAALSESLYSIIGNENVVKKVWVPTEVFPASTVLGQLVHFFLAMLVLAFFIILFSIIGKYPEGSQFAGQSLGLILYPSWEILLLPFLILLQTILVFGISLILSSLNVFFRDSASITEIMLSAWFYLTPIIYPANFARNELQDKGLEFLYWIYLLNPMAPISIGYRRIFFGRLFNEGPEVSDHTLMLSLGAATSTSLIILFIGIKLFRKMSTRFADEL